MLPNGQAAVIRMALRSRPEIEQFAAPLLLGAMRADVWYIPLFGRVVEHMSFSHFYRARVPGGFLPFLTRGTRTMARHYFAQALDEHRAGRTVAAYVRLGAVSHLIADMACPVHVHRVIHENDPYEWYVEAHHAELRRLPLPDARDVDAPEELIDSLAAITRAFEPDRTSYSIGRMLRRAGLRRSIPREAIAAQARTLIPLAAAHTASLLRLFTRATAA
jgi:hypothetical protein